METRRIVKQSLFIFGHPKKQTVTPSSSGQWVAKYFDKSKTPHFPHFFFYLSGLAWVPTRSGNGGRLFARRTFTTPKIRTFPTPKFGHLPPPKTVHLPGGQLPPPFIFFFFFWRTFLYFFDLPLALMQDNKDGKEEVLDEVVMEHIK